MKIGIGTRIVLVLGVVIFAFIVLGTFRAPSTESVQWGYRGTGMDQIYHRAELASISQTNGVPKDLKAAKESGKKASEVYKNLKVLGDVDVANFGRIMASMATWVAPTQSCNYCHKNGDFASDDLYTKKVARRMLQMTRHINKDWQKHVGETGVSCYTCHRGQPVPAYVWYDPSAGAGSGLGGLSKLAGDTTLGDPFPAYLDNKNEIRVVPNNVLPVSAPSSIQNAEGTYGLMMHFSSALGVNCTFCHNTRSFTSWDQSTPQRNTAWYGIRMVRDLNKTYLGSLKDVFPQARLGPHGDVPKLDCQTCHQGAYKPLLGAKVAKDFPELRDTNDVASKKEGEAPAAPAPSDDKAKPGEDKPK